MTRTSRDSDVKRMEVFVALSKAIVRFASANERNFDTAEIPSQLAVEDAVN